MACLKGYRSVQRQHTPRLEKRQHTGAWFWLLLDIGSLTRMGRSRRPLHAGYCTAHCPHSGARGLTSNDAFARSIVPGLALLTKRDPRINAVLEAFFA